MPEQIYTFTNEEVVRMLESGELRLLTVPEPVQKIAKKTEHEKALEKAKKLFGKDFKDVQTLEIGGKSVEQLKQALEQANMIVSNSVNKLLDSPDFTTLPNPQNIELIKLKVRDLGFEEGATLQQIYQKAQELGLELCPAEVGPYLRLKDIDQPLGGWYSIAMKQIDSDGRLRLFDLERGVDDLFLNGYWELHDYEWDPAHELVFSYHDDT